MDSKVIDLRKTGKEFALFGSVACPDNIKNLPNDKLGRSFREDLCKVYKALFGKDMPITSDEFSFILSFKNNQFNKVYYPCLVRGNETNELASNPDMLYIRWGSTFLPLNPKEEKKGNRKEVLFFDSDGEQLDFQITGYPFNGDKYIDPSFEVTIYEESGDILVMNFPIKYIPVKDLKDGEEVDYVNDLKTSLKKGLNTFMSKISEAKEYKPLGKAISASDLPLNTVLLVNDYVITTSKNGRQIVKLTLAEPLIEEDGSEVAEVWCPYSLVNYLKTNPGITPKTPECIVLCGSEEQVSKSNGKTYLNPLLAISTPDSELLNVQFFSNGDKIEDEASLDAVYKETLELVINPNRYSTTYSDRDLDTDVEYKVTKSIVRDNSKGGKCYKLLVLDPRDSKSIEIWCPNNLIPTINKLGEIGPDSLITFKVVSKTERAGKTYAHSILDLGSRDEEDEMDLSFL